MRLTTGCRAAITLAGSAIVVGCATVEPSRPVLRPPLPPVAKVAPGPEVYRASEFAWSTALGPNTILGSIDYHPAPKEVWSCSGQSVGLTPETAYSAERMRILYGSSVQAVEPVPIVRARGASRPGADYSQFARAVTCDARDTFTFRNLPDGSYFLLARIHQRGRPVTDEAGLVILQRIDLRHGEVRQVILPHRP